MSVIIVVDLPTAAAARAVEVDRSQSVAASEADCIAGNQIGDRRHRHRSRDVDQDADRQTLFVVVYWRWQSYVDQAQLVSASRVGFIYLFLCQIFADKHLVLHNTNIAEAC